LVKLYNKIKRGEQRWQLKNGGRFEKWK
jgi:hypothetical protein